MTTEELVRNMSTVYEGEWYISPDGYLRNAYQNRAPVCHINIIKKILIAAGVELEDV